MLNENESSGHLRRFKLSSKEDISALSRTAPLTRIDRKIKPLLKSLFDILGALMFLLQVVNM